MLGSIEKLQFFVSGFILFAVLALYLLLGAPEPRNYLPAPSRSNETIVDVTTQGTASASSLPTASAAAPQPTEDDRRTMDAVRQLTKQHRKPLRSQTALRKIDYGVPPEKLDVIRKPANWMPELNRAASKAILDQSGRPTMLRVDSIDKDSILAEFGLEDGDEVCLLDDEPLEFHQGQSGDYIRRAEAIFERLESGGSLSLTVLRNGQPTKLEYRLKR